ncbi:MAG: hypothetical protein INH41_29305 [Myxococcaceae bacterium]|jgi:hypothetical protein|nr:hypothetical protein [Myxococcaceae bacterium]MCA3016500.1 hypothetical protein [Myxococcaceae bacterium]
MSASPSMLGRFLPTGPQERATLFAKAAQEDEARGLLQSAETNLRLALCFVPGDAAVTEALAALVARRERERQAGR